MSKVEWKSGTFIYPIPAVMVTSGNMEKSNIMTVAWTGIINTNPAMVYISVRPNRFSYELIKKQREFVINLTNKDLVFATDWCGVKSGAEFDKFKEMNLTKEKGKFVKCPLIKESPVSVECKVKEIKELGSHNMIIAEVLSIDADEKYIEVSKSMETPFFKHIFRLIIPGAAPNIFTGLRIGLSSGWMCVVAAELVSSTTGLGYMIMNARQFGQTDVVIVGMLTIGIIGKLMDSLLRAVEKRAIKWNWSE